jgi:hypothetical protein
MIMSKNSLSLRNASDFYAIPLPDDYILTEEALEKSIDKKTSKQGGWFYPQLKLLSFKNGMAEIVNKLDKTSFRLYLKVGPEKLHVSCSCGMEVETLCIHAFKALSRLVVFDDLGNLKRFMPNDAAQIVFENKRYFETKPGLNNMFKPKATLGSVYGINETLADYSIEDVLALPAQLPDKKEIKETSMCYIIMYSRRNDFLPFLLPCIGKLNKAGDNIKSFGNFLSGIQKEYDALLTEEQRALNSICLALYKQVEKLPYELIHEEMSYHETDGLSNVFNLWQKAIPLLGQQYTYTHPYFQKRQLKGKPFLSWMKKINIKETVPTIEFKLTDKGAFYQLEIKPVINGKTISNYEMPDTFFISEGNHVYLLSSVRDAVIAEWMEKSGKRITIFKKHFAQFERNFLQPLAKYYPVQK